MFETKKDVFPKSSFNGLYPLFVNVQLSFEKFYINS